jgi:hypothetical protein
MSKLWLRRRRQGDKERVRDQEKGSGKGEKKTR